MASTTAPRSDASPRANPKSPGSTTWTINAHCIYRCGVHELRVSDASEVGTGQAPEFALIEEGLLLLLGYRLQESASWMIAEHRPSARRPAEWELPNVGGFLEERAMLSLIDERADATLRPVRNYTLSLDFTRSLHTAIRERASSMREPREYDRALASLPGRWPSPRALVARSHVRTVGLL